MENPWEELPIFKKADEIRKLVDSIVEIAMEAEMNFESEEEGKMIDDSINFLIDNSITIPAKIAIAHDEDTYYDIRMENAVLIRMAARELLTDADILESFGFKETEYLDILRNEVDELRILFAEWVNTFDPWHYAHDNWGLFNPPGVNYDDVDPDENLPWDEDFDDDDDDDY